MKQLEGTKKSEERINEIRESASKNFKRFRRVLDVGISYIAIGDLEHDIPAIFQSFDGKDWRIRWSGMTNQILFDLTYGGVPGVFVAVGTNRAVLFSTGGLTWGVCAELINRMHPLYCVEYINNRFVAAGMREIIISLNGRDWTSVDIPDEFKDSRFTKVEYKNNMYIFTTDEDIRISTKDFKSWNQSGEEYCIDPKTRNWH